MMASEMEELVPLSRAAILYRMARERVLRRVQNGEIRGEMRDGRWYVAPPQHEQSDEA